MSKATPLVRFLAVVCLVALATGGGYFLGRKSVGHELSTPSQTPPHQGVDATPSPSKGRKILYYRNPMNPSITSPVPAKDEMGMDYIPVYADEVDATRPAGTVKIDPVMVQKMGIRLAKVDCMVLKREVRAPGRVEYDQERLWSVHPKFKGWVEELYVAKTGDEVVGGQPLLSIYSPELVATQQEFLLALAAGGNGGGGSGPFGLKDAALSRLELFGVPISFIKELESSRKVRRTISLKAPGKGVVLKVGALPGDYVTPKSELFRICDLSQVWVIAEIYESDLPWVREGDMVEVETPVMPGQTVKGRVDFVYPEVEGKTRTVPVRVVMDNTKRLLRPGMFVDVAIFSGLERKALVVPSEAVVRSGKEERVFVQTSPGVFEPRKVKLGLEAQGMAEVLSGVSHGEEVVVSAQFLIDSESKLKEAAAKMMRSGTAQGDSGAKGPKQQGAGR